MSKRIKPITWILMPIWMPCMACEKEQSVNEVIIDEAYHLTMCGPCSQLPEAELKAKLFKRKAVK